MTRKEEILGVLLVMCAAGWALEYHHSQTSAELAALRQVALQGNIAAQSQFASLTAADFASLTTSAASDIAATIQRELGSAHSAIPKHTLDKDQTP